MTEILYRDEAYKIVGCCMQVHGVLGAGFLEEVYQEALEKEFIAAGIPYEREAKLTIMYRGQPLTGPFAQIRPIREDSRSEASPAAGGKS